MRILFIGNSHTYFNDMPHLFSMMCRNGAGVDADVTMLAYSGRTLEWHEKEYFSVRFNLLYGNYDYCVIQQAAHPFPPEEETVPYAKQIIELCRTVDTVPVLYMTWAEKEKAENQQKMIDVYSNLAKETGALLAPIGLIWQGVRKLDPDIELYYTDGEHASVYGDYLIAATFYAVITRGDARKLDSTALDFSRGRPMGFDTPRVIEQEEETRCKLDHIKCGIITQTIGQFVPAMM